MRVDARDTDDGCGTARTCVQNSRHYSVACKTIQECRISGSPLHAAVARRPTQRQLHCETRDSPRLYSSVVAQYSPRCTLSHGRGAALQSRRRRIPRVVLLAQRTRTRSGWARRRSSPLRYDARQLRDDNHPEWRSGEFVRHLHRMRDTIEHLVALASRDAHLCVCALACTWRLLGGREFLRGPPGILLHPASPSRTSFARRGLTRRRPPRRPHK